MGSVMLSKEHTSWAANLLLTLEGVTHATDFFHRSNKMNTPAFSQELLRWKMLLEQKPHHFIALAVFLAWANVLHPPEGWSQNTRSFVHLPVSTPLNLHAEHPSVSQNHPRFVLHIFATLCSFGPHWTSAFKLLLSFLWLNGEAEGTDRDGREDQREMLRRYCRACQPTRGPTAGWVDGFPLSLLFLSWID